MLRLQQFCFICPQRLKDNVAIPRKVQFVLRPHFQNLNQINLIQKISIPSLNQNHPDEEGSSLDQ